MKLGYIYKITSPSNKIYIGQTKNLKKRLRSYKALNCSKQRKLYNSFKYYGWENHKFEIVCGGEFSRSSLNMLEKHYIKLFNSFSEGLNCTLGGDGFEGARIHKHSEETKAMFSKTRKGMGSKPINQYTLEGIFIRSWNSIKEAGDLLKIDRPGISRCISGHRRNAGGFVWKNTSE